MAAALPAGRQQQHHGWGTMRRARAQLGTATAVSPVRGPHGHGEPGSTAGHQRVSVAVSHQSLELQRARPALRLRPSPWHRLVEGQGHITVSSLIYFTWKLAKQYKHQGLYLCGLKTKFQYFLLLLLVQKSFQYYKPQVPGKFKANRRSSSWQPVKSPDSCMPRGILLQLSVLLTTNVT